MVETAFGVLTLAGMLVAVDCVEHKSRDMTTMGGAGTSAVWQPVERVCKAGTRPQLLCDRVTKDRAHECAICLDVLCKTQTGIFCAVSCDDPACVPR